MTRLTVKSFFRALAAIALLCGTLLAEEKAQSYLLSSFEPGGPNVVTSDGKPVKEHASDGEHSLKVDSDGKEYVGIKIVDKEALKKFAGFILFKVDVFNPTDEVVYLGARIDDAKSTPERGYGGRYNDDYLVAPPGKSTVEINLTGIARSNAKNWSLREPMDLSTLSLVEIWIAPKGKPATLYFDNVRLETSGLPAVEGLRAVDFGPAKSPIYPGFEPANELMLWADGASKGWVKPDWFDNIYMPDSLTGDFGSGKEFCLKLPNGAYEVQMCIDPFGIFHTLPHFTFRKVTINGKVVLDEKMAGLDFLDKVYLLHEDDEDLPGQDLWKKFIEPRNVIRRFDAEVSEGVLRVSVDADSKYGKQMCFLVVYPATKKDEGRAFMDTLQKKRHDKFNETMIVRVPRAKDRVHMAWASAGPRMIVCQSYLDQDVNLRDEPFWQREEKVSPDEIRAAQGERTNLVLVLRSLVDLKGVKVTVSDFVGDGPQPAKIPASAVQVRKARVFLKRASRARMGDLMPYILQEFKTLDLTGGVNRNLWLTVTVPANAAAGWYSGGITVADAKGEVAGTGLSLRVLPFQLDKVTDITLSVTGSTAGMWRGWFPEKEYEAKWWQMAEIMMKDQADHGMNAVTGGPSAVLKGIKDGKAEIDYAPMDRWMELAVKYGLTMPGDSYQGFDIAGVPNNYRKGGMELNEKESKEQFGIPFKDVIRIAYGDLAKHAKEKGWPKRVYYFLDEPRANFGNIEIAAELIKARIEAAPDTLFSGYYSEGEGRDVYFGMMPVSIAHINKKTLELTRAGGKELWSYDGNRVRYNIGRYAFVAARAGLKGYLRNGYMYVNSAPYFDFTDDEASWCVTYPSRSGISDTVGWERTAEGVNDYRYLLTCENLIKKARAEKKAQAEADAAEAYMKETLKPIDLENSATAQMTPPQYDTFRQTLARHIEALRKALGQ